MNTLIQRAAAWLAAGMLLAATLPAHAESFAVNHPMTEKLIEFQVDLRPWDPFSDANKVGAPKEFGRGEVIRLVIQGAPHEGFHTYPLTRQIKQASGNSTALEIVDNGALKILGPPSATPPPAPANFLGEVVLEQSVPFVWTQDLYVRPDAAVGANHLHFTLKVQVCNDGGCHYGDHEFEIPFAIIDSPVVPPPADLDKRLQFTPPPPEMLNFQGKDYSVVPLAAEKLVAPPAPPPPAAVQPDRAPGVAADNARNSGHAAKDAPTGPVQIIRKDGARTTAPPPGGLWDLLFFMWQGIVFGAVSLLTPCVFPMIPITVSYFLKQAEKSGKPSPGTDAPRRTHSPLLMAAVYSSTIAVVLTVAGVLLLRLVQPFSQHWATNLVLGGLFVFFALSLFGMYDIVLPSGLGRLTAAGEGRGGLVGVVFMALTFTVISFACVAPFYGGFIALTASAASAADWIKLVLGALAFSVTFALPFFVLALFPSLLKALPKSGSWLNTVKVVMGFLELAAAFKFLRAAEINYFTVSQFLTYDLVLGIYIALAVACGLYLLGVYRLPHDHGAPESLSVPRLLFSIAFLGLALYLTPALFKTAVANPQQRVVERQVRPDGTVFAWLNAFLLPEKSDLPWVGDLRKGLQTAKAEDKLVFLDFTAQTCTNCKYNEDSIFTQKEVRDELDRYVLVHLYTDKVPPGYHSSTTGPQNQQMQADVFGSDQLPLYAILEPIDDDGSRAYLLGDAYPEGKINDVSGFAQYLQAAAERRRRRRRGLRRAASDPFILPPSPRFGGEGPGVRGDASETIPPHPQPLSPEGRGEEEVTAAPVQRRPRRSPATVRPSAGRRRRWPAPARP